MLNIAHRGASGEGLAPENTLAAFRLAMEIGADLVELDVHRTKDGKIVVIHDDSMDRTTDRFGRIKDLNVSDIVGADAGVGERVPLLVEALDMMRGRTIVLVEVKPNDITGDVIQQIREAEAEDYVVIQSFHPEVVVESFALAPGIPRGMLIGEREDLSDRTVSVGAGVVVPSYRLLTEQTIHNIRLHGLGLWTYTVDDEAEMRRLMDLGVDAIITNYPNRLKALTD